MLNKDFLKQAYPLRGDFIVFEGCDGVGKTTLAESLTKYLNAKNIQTICTYEPTKHMKGIIKEGVELNTEYNDIQSFMLDRLQHSTNTIFPALRQNKAVVCDRYDWSTLVYQDITNLERQEAYLEIMNLVSHDIWIQPNLYVYCYAKPELIQKRLMIRDSEVPNINEIQSICDRYEDIVAFFYKNHPNNLLIFEIEECMTVEQQVEELYLGIEEKLWM